jgi:hypothetical protein
MSAKVTKNIFMKKINSFKKVQLRANFKSIGTG